MVVEFVVLAVLCASMPMLGDPMVALRDRVPMFIEMSNGMPVLIEVSSGMSMFIDMSDGGMSRNGMAGLGRGLWGGSVMFLLLRRLVGRRSL